MGLQGGQLPLAALSAIGVNVSASAVVSPTLPLDALEPYRLRTAMFARELASELSARGMWDIEKPSERASLRQVQLRE